MFGWDDLEPNAYLNVDYIKSYQDLGMARACRVQSEQFGFSATDSDGEMKDTGGDPLPLLAGPVAQRESPRTLSACVCVEGRGDPGYRFAQPGANVRAALSGCWFARRRREGN